jgi:hypothetical protein
LLKQVPLLKKLDIFCAFNIDTVAFVNLTTFKNSKGKPYQPMDFKNLKEKIRDPKVLILLPNVCDFQKIPYLRVRIYKTIENL